MPEILILLIYLAAAAVLVAVLWRCARRSARRKATLARLVPLDVVDYRAFAERQAKARAELEADLAERRQRAIEKADQARDIARRALDRSLEAERREVRS